MARTPILSPTTAAANTTPMSLLPLVWSPDPALCATRRIDQTGNPVNVLYDGHHLAHRNWRVMLIAGRGHELPADARLEAWVKTHDAIFQDGVMIEEAQFEPVPEWDLTPTRKTRTFSIAIDDLEWRKAESETPYGAVSWGAFGATNGSSS